MNNNARKAAFTRVAGLGSAEADEASYCLQYRQPALGDVTGDGILDIVGVQVVDNNGTRATVPSVQLFPGVGDGTFLGPDATFASLPEASPGDTARSYTGGPAYMEAHLADVDGDSDLDILLMPAVSTETFVLLINDGSGGFSSASMPADLMPSACSLLKLADIDNVRSSHPICEQHAAESLQHIEVACPDLSRSSCARAGR